MEKFKVGDIVRRIDEPNDGNGLTLDVGTEAKVVSVSCGWLVLEGYEKMGVSNSKFFELVKPAMTMAQEFAIAAGIQSHSVGDLYPVAVVGYQAKATCPIVYFLENLQEGTVAMSEFGSPLPLLSTDDALALSQRHDLKWEKGRPQFVVNAWRLYNPTNPVRVVRLQNMLHRNTDSSCN